MKPNCNQDLILDIMNHSKFGPMAEVFVMSALSQYAEAIAKQDLTLLSYDMGRNPIVKPELWHGLATDIKRRIDAFYSRHDAPAPAASAASNDCAAQLQMYCAFFMEGLRDTGAYKEILEKWDRGCLELVSELNFYAAPLQTLADAACTIYPTDDLSHPGIIEYEVASGFGEWFGNQVLSTGDVPAKADCLRWLADSVIDFFGGKGSNKGILTAEQESKLDDAVETAILDLM